MMTTNIQVAFKLFVVLFIASRIGGGVKFIPDDPRNKKVQV